MLREILTEVGDTIGVIVYAAAYGPIYIVWNLIGRHVVRAFASVIDSSRRHEIRLMLDSSVSMDTLRQMVLRIYVNFIQQQAQERLTGGNA